MTTRCITCGQDLEPRTTVALTEEQNRFVLDTVRERVRILRIDRPGHSDPLIGPLIEIGEGLVKSYEMCAGYWEEAKK